VTTAQTFLFFLLLLGVVAALLRLASQRAPALPYQVVLAAAGILLGLLPGLHLPRVGADLILLAFVPGLVFEAALTLDLAELRRRALHVGLLATVGVLVGVLVMAALLRFALGFAWPSAFILSAIVAATDPIAVISVLRGLRAPAGLTAILEGESLFNDGTGVAVFAAVLASVLSGAPSLGDAAGRFLVLTVGGAAVGVVAGAASVLLLRRAQEAELEILLTLVAAYGSYLLADVLHFSGIVAVVIAGMAVARFARRSGRLQGTQLLGFWNLLAFVLNAVLFVLVGAALPTPSLLRLVPLVIGAYLAMVVARAPAVYGLTWWGGVPWAWRHLAFWGGLRGALSIALALAVAASPSIDPRVSTVAYGVVVLSLLVQGGLVVPLARRLGLSGA